MIGTQTRLGGVHVLSLMFSVVALLGRAPAAAQCGRQWLPGAPNPGTAGGVYSIVVLPDGDIIVGGRFESAGNVRDWRCEVPLGDRELVGVGFRNNRIGGRTDLVPER